MNRRFWIITHPNFGPQKETLAEHRYSAIGRLLLLVATSPGTPPLKWKDAYRLGYRALPVRLTPVWHLATTKHEKTA